VRNILPAYGYNEEGVIIGAFLFLLKNSKKIMNPLEKYWKNEYHKKCC
jgi:hypothetical protein